MTPMSSSHQQNSEYQFQDRDEIDLKEIGKCLLRHKFVIIKIASISLLISGLFAYTRKPVWEGQFQIVLQSGQKTSNRAMSMLRLSRHSKFNWTQGNSSDLKTEVEILKALQF